MAKVTFTLEDREKDGTLSVTVESDPPFDEREIGVYTLAQSVAANLFGHLSKMLVKDGETELEYDDDEEDFDLEDPDDEDVPVSN